MYIQEGMMRKMSPNDAIPVVWAVGAFFYYYSCFYYINLFLQLLQQFGQTYRRLRRGERAQTTRIASFGPLVRPFSFFSCFYIYTNHLIGSNGIIKLRRYLREVTTKRTGPNDAIHVVWAISKCFLFYFRVF